MWLRLFSFSNYVVEIEIVMQFSLDVTIDGLPINALFCFIFYSCVCHLCMVFIFLKLSKFDEWLEYLA